MPIQALKDYLNTHNVKYRVIAHSPAFTAQEVAASAHVSGRNMAKTVILKMDGRLTMVVIPATERVDLEELKQATGAKDIILATEEEFRGEFPGCEVGSMPPFGNLFGMDVYASHKLAQEHDIAFNAGTHTELIDLAFEDFEGLTHPTII